MEHSKSWRAMGDGAAFAPFAWEFQARLFYRAARGLRAKDPMLTNEVDEDGIAGLVVGQFDMALAVELIAKAYYLSAMLGPPEQVYQHEVLKLVPADMLTERERKLMQFATNCVVWAGRYPTPKWTTEKNKLAWDVPELDGAINGADIPNAASGARIDELGALFEHLHAAYSASEKQTSSPPGNSS